MTARYRNYADVHAGAPAWDVMQVSHARCNKVADKACLKARSGAAYHRRGAHSGALSSVVWAYSRGTSPGVFDSCAIRRAPGRLLGYRKFPGKRGLRQQRKYTLEIALLADGVEPRTYMHALDGAGVARAFRSSINPQGHCLVGGRQRSQERSLHRQS